MFKQSQSADDIAASMVHSLEPTRNDVKNAIACLSKAGDLLGKTHYAKIVNAMVNKLEESEKA